MDLVLYFRWYHSGLNIKLFYISSKPVGQIFFLFALAIGERPEWVMADIDTCMIQKFVPRARQINEFPFDDKEFCPVGLQCFKLPAMERNYYFLLAFLFKPAKQLKLGFIYLFTLTSFKIMCNILPNKLNWRCLIHWAQRMKVLRAERVSALSVFFSLLYIPKQEIKG